MGHKIIANLDGGGVSLKIKEVKHRFAKTGMVKTTYHCEFIRDKFKSKLCRVVELDEYPQVLELLVYFITVQDDNSAGDEARKFFERNANLYPLWIWGYVKELELPE